MNGVLTNIVFLSTFFIAIACGGTGNGSASVSSVKAVEKTEPVKYIKGLKLQLKQTNFTFGEKIDIQFDAKKMNVDSVQYFYDSRHIATTRKDTSSYPFQIPARTGVHSVKIIAYLPDNQQSISVKAITVKPSENPRKLSYTVKRIYSHDNQAYTQGLLLYDGYMYEGTGINGKSGIRKYKIENNNSLKKIDLDEKYFGEGITIVNNKIYQLTWLAKIGFVYDLQTMEQIGTFSYNTEGWGLTHSPDKTLFIMSDGSNQLTFRKIDNFGTIVKTLEVYDNEQPIRNLNELEYIQGRIWANVWQSDEIMIINPETGAVEAYLDLSEILTKTEREALAPRDEVLNGIAYNAESETVYVTGKRWSKMFEIKVESWK